VLVYVATKNVGKLRELRAILEPQGWTLATFDAYADPDEGDTSYAENAALKARALAAQLGAAGLTAAVLGDDSGIEVSALGNRPGVLSARFGGEGATWAMRRASLVRELDDSGSSDRSARFVDALHFIATDGSETTSFGDVAGVIPLAERGDGGFSYDAIFEERTTGRTFAEIPEAEKNAISHRARACRALIDALSATPTGNLS
jgi:XTP/dITP diphosphohydrolase